MHRVIRTDFYFDDYQVDWIDGSISQDNPGISVAWFKTDPERFAASRIGADDFPPIPNFDVIFGGSKERNHRDSLTRFMHFLLLAGPEELRTNDALEKYYLEKPRRLSPANAELIENCLEHKVMVERSPVTEVPFGQLIKAGGSVAIGTFVGMSVAAQAPVLMIITVPAGIIVVGTAVGVAKGLESGLHRAIERWLAPPSEANRADRKVKRSRRINKK